MSRHGPAFQFFAAEALSDEGWVRMSFEARGVFITLLCHQWIEGSIPADVREIARLLHIDVRRFARLWDEVGEKFDLLPPEVPPKSEGSVAKVSEKCRRLVNEKLARMRSSDAEYRERQAEAGKKGNEAKQGLRDTEADEKDQATRKQSGRKATANPHGSRPQSVRSSPSSSPSGVPPKAPQGAGDRSAPTPEAEPEPWTQELRRVRVVFAGVGWRQPQWTIDGRLIGFTQADGTKADAEKLLAASMAKDSPSGWLWTVIASEASWRAVLADADHGAKLREQRKTAQSNHDPDFGDSAPPTGVASC